MLACSGQNLIFFDLSGQDLQCELATDLIGNFYALERLDLSNNNLQIECVSTSYFLVAFSGYDPHQVRSCCFQYGHLRPAPVALLLSHGP